MINKATNVELLHNSIRLNRKEERKKQFNLLPQPRQTKDSFESSESAVKTKPKENKGLPFWQAGLAGGLLLVLGIVGTGTYFKWGAKATTPITNSAEEGLGKLKNLLSTLPENVKPEDVVTAIEQKIETLNRELKTTKEQKESAEQVVLSLTEKLNQQLRTINNLEAKITQLEANSSGALGSQEKTQLEQEIERLTQELSFAQLDVGQLTTNLENANKKISKHFEKSTAFENTIRNLEAEITTLTQEKEKQALLLNADKIREALETLPTLSTKITPKMSAGETILTQQELEVLLKAIALEEDDNFLGAGSSKAYGLPAHIDPNQDYCLLIHGGLEGAKPADLVKVGDPNLEDLPNVSALVATAGNMKLLKRVSGLPAQQPHRQQIRALFDDNHGTVSEELKRFVSDPSDSEAYETWQKLETSNVALFQKEQRQLNEVQTAYVNYVKNLSEIPEASWKDFFNTAKTLAERGYDLDLQHPNNLMVDFKKQTFGFVDLQDNKRSDIENAKYNPKPLASLILWANGLRDGIQETFKEEVLISDFKKHMTICIETMNKALVSLGEEPINYKKGLKTKFVGND